MLDGKPIVGIVTGLKNKSNNPKTGDMAQFWILREDMPPTEAKRTGADSSICGDCPLKKTCYVTIHQAPLAVWKAYKRGSYTNVTGLYLNKAIRLGAYGDPAAVPQMVIDSLTNNAPKWTGYTHQWDHPNISLTWNKYVMASVESKETKDKANRFGWRTFRVREAGAPLFEDEINCPSDKGITCAQCGLCSGTKVQAKNISIEVHGSKKGNF